MVTKHLDLIYLPLNHTDLHSGLGQLQPSGSASEGGTAMSVVFKSVQLPERVVLPRSV
jgi:hypothetical protein